MSPGRAADPGRRALLAAAGAALLGGCVPQPRADGDVQARPFQLRDLGKTDIDTVAELHLDAVLAYAREMTLKLYRRNPREWRRTGKPSGEHVVERIFRGERVPDFAELDGARGTDAIRLAFDDGYDGDRVLAFGAGLAAMIQAAYGDRREFFVVDELDPQKLYNSARNVEIAAWKLGNDRRPDGAPYLLSNSRADEPRNLSYERLFGKMIALQDAIAEVIAERSNRTIRIIVQRLAGAVFLPI